MADNRIYIIDEDAFTGFTYLQSLDLSNNVLLNMPNSILQLPSLRKLYLKGNPILYTSNELAITRPIKAPLELLDISDCKIKVLPYWGSLPQLVFYNISYNPLTTLNTSHFAPMCNLEKVDLTESTDDLKLCSMRSPFLWFQEKRISFQLEDYSKLNTRGIQHYTIFTLLNKWVFILFITNLFILISEFEKCPSNDLILHNATYNRCKAEYLQVCIFFCFYKVFQLAVLRKYALMNVRNYIFANSKYF